MTEQEFRDSCAKFEIKVLLGMNDYLLCKWNEITFGHYNKINYIAVITYNFIKHKFFYMGQSFNYVNGDLEHTTNFLHNDKMEERFAFLIKMYKQDIINERLKKLEYDFQ